MRSSGHFHTFVMKRARMNIETFRDHCLSYKGVTESFPFDATTLVFKVMNKMFALTDLEGPFQFTVKCEPEEGLGWQEHYACVRPAWHMNKRHWIMVRPEPGLDDETMKKLIARSYELVVNGLTRKEKEQLMR